MLANLQLLRALAAVALVVFHFGLMPPTKLPFMVGAAGVEPPIEQAISAGGVDDRPSR